jgi:hypothetical protein
LETIWPSHFGLHEWLLWVKASIQFRSNLTLPLKSDTNYYNISKRHPTTSDRRLREDDVKYSVMVCFG